ncbi:transposase [Streptomyces sp. NPDC019531]|uniref:transposase n=1 Tax=Streptomyces sp. NPDC019531 TaxID=3365062 RepID=UPI003850BCB1
MRLPESLRTADDVETIRSLCEHIPQKLIETEAIGAAPREHSGERTTWRNGHRESLLTTQAADLDLEITKVRTGPFFPSPLERHRHIGWALFAVVMGAYVHGVLTSSVDDLVKALGMGSDISKSEVSRTCGELDAELTAFKERPLDCHIPPPAQFTAQALLSGRQFAPRRQRACAHGTPTPNLPIPMRFGSARRGRSGMTPGRERRSLNGLL